MFTVFEEVSQGKYNRAVTSSSAKKRRSSLLQLTFDKKGRPEIRGQVIESLDHIRLEDVPVITPNCDIVVPSLTITVSLSFSLGLSLSLFSVCLPRHSL